MSPTITQAFPPLPLDEVSAIVSGFDAMTSSEKKAAIERLVLSHPIINVDWGAGSRYRRARILNADQRPETVDELIWRKDVPATLGRANPEGFSVIYLGDRQDTALNEARVDDDLAVVADFVIQEDRSLRIAPIGELIEIQRTGRGRFSGDSSDVLNGMLNACDRQEARALLIIDAFLLQCLVGHDDYDISAHLVLSIFNKTPGLKAVAYPSVRQLGGVNFAIRTETFWDNWALSSVRYGQAKHLAMGFYQFSDTQAVDQIDDEGRLTWRDVDNPEVTVMFVNPWIGKNDV